MRVTRFSSRTGHPAFFDMASRFGTPSARRKWYGRGFRIGDRCVAHVHLAEWRKHNPSSRLVVVEDSVSWPETRHSGQLPAVWFAGGLADEVWTVERAGEVVPRPAGHNLYYDSLGALWRQLRVSRAATPYLRPAPSPTAAAGIAGLPKGYVTLQPLVEAEGNTWRKAAPEWWSSVIQLAAAQMPLVLLGDRSVGSRFSPPPGVVCLWGWSVMDSLAVVAGAAAHVGGETGFTLWSGYFGAPTVAVYRNWKAGKPRDWRPLEFGRPMVFGQLNGDPALIAREAARLRLLS